MRRFLLISAWIVTALLCGVPLWWWALRGMSANVAFAWFITDLVLVPAVIGLSVAATS